MQGQSYGVVLSQQKLFVKRIGHLFYYLSTVAGKQIVIFPTHLTTLAKHHQRVQKKLFADRII